MPALFRKTLGADQGPVNPAAYDLLVQELAKLQAEGDAPAQPMFTQDEQRDRVRQSNDALRVGVEGALAPDEQIRTMGSRVFAKTLADRDERESERGTFNPLTGETRESPEYARRRRDERRAKVMTDILRYEDKRESAEERAAQKARDELFRADQAEKDRFFRKTLAGMKKDTDAELTDLRKKLIRAQIDATQGRADLADDKRTSVADKAKNAAQNAVNKARLIVNNIDTALGQTGKTTTGFLGSQIGKIPGTTAYDLRSTVATIKANIGFEELQAMRQASPTGGALGQVAVQELNFLQAVLGNLDANQSEAQMRKNLGDIKTHYRNWENAMIQHAEETRNAAEARRPGYGDSEAPAPGQPSPGAPAPSPRRRGTDAPPEGVTPAEWKAMTPQERGLFR